MAVPAVVEKKSGVLTFPAIAAVEYIGNDIGHVRFQSGQCLKFDWASINVAATAMRAVVAYREHCKELLAKHLEAQAQPAPPQGPDYSKVEDGKHYWIKVLASYRDETTWLVACYHTTAFGWWRPLGTRDCIETERVVAIGERVPHPEDK